LAAGTYQEQLNYNRIRSRMKKEIGKSSDRSKKYFMPNFKKKDGNLVLFYCLA
jgi:hypothetical protein